MSWKNPIRPKEVDNSFFEPETKTVDESFFDNSEKKSSDLSVGQGGQLEDSAPSISQSQLGNNPFDIKGSLTSNKLDNKPLPQTLDEAHTQDVDISKAVVGNVWNRILHGFSSIPAAAGDLTAQLILKVMPPEPGMTKEESLKKFRQDFTPAVRTGNEDLIGANVTDKQKENFNKNFWTSALGGLAETAPAMLYPKGSGFLLQAYDNGLQAIDNAPKGKDLPESTKTIFGLGVGAAQAVIMKLGLDKIFGKQTSRAATNLAINTFNNLVKTAKEPITAELFEAALSTAAKSLKSTVINTGTKVATSAATGFLMGSAIEGSNQLAEAITSKAEGEDVFEPTTWGQKVKNIIHAGASTAVGGAILGGATSAFSKTRNYIAEKVADAKAPEDITNLKNELIFKAKDLAPEEAQQLGQTIDDYVRVNAKVPEDVPNRKEVVDKILEREDIEKTADQKTQELQTVDDAFKPEMQKEVDLLNSKAQDINEEIVNPKPENIIQPNEINQEANIENKQPIEQAEAAQPNIEGVSETAQPAETVKPKIEPPSDAELTSMMKPLRGKVKSQTVDVNVIDPTTNEVVPKKMKAKEAHLETVKQIKLLDLITDCLTKTA